MGLVIGVTIGLVLGPAIRYWLAWRVWRESRENDLTDRMHEHLLNELEQLFDESPEEVDGLLPKAPRSSGASRAARVPGERSRRLGTRRRGRLGAARPRT
jgi:hypothetical protein